MHTKHALPLLLLAYSLTTGAQRQFVITGTMLNDSLCYSEATVKKVYLTHEVNSQEVVIDSATVMNKQFSFKGEAPEVVTPYTITGFDNGAVQLFLESGNIVIQPFNAQYPSHAKVEGTLANNTIAEYQRLTDEMGKKGMQRLDSMKRGMSLGELANKMMVERYQWSANCANSFDLQAATMHFVCQHLNSPVVLYIIKNQLLQYFKPEIIESQLFSAIPAETRKHPIYKKLINLVRASNMQIGNPAPDVEGETPDGKTLSLSQLRGKYVLLDFWASWCAPCRREFAFIKRALKTTGDKAQFVVLSYSIDSKKKDWTDCITKNKIANDDWQHITTLKGWDSEALKLYNATSVPCTILISPKGNIVGYDLRGEQLINTVKRLKNGEQRHD